MIIHPNDNVEVLIEAQGEIPAGHKVALRPIYKGEDVVKYGFPIGHASRDINKGEWVHSHNLETNLKSTLEYEYNPQSLSKSETWRSALPLSSGKNLKPETCFLGYERENGTTGIRNELWIIPTVGCVADLTNTLAAEMQKETSLTVRALPHTFGCSQLGEDHENTRHLLAALAEHPNAGGVLVLGLGCENNQVSQLRPLIHSPRVRFLEAQSVEDEHEEALSLLRELARQAESFERMPQPLSKLCIGLKCGGSDGFSGITANPLLGRFSDRFVAQGGTTVLTEVPEMFGAETILMNRCKDRDTFDQTVSLINNFKDYYLSHNLPVGENPSPGNKAGGITTLEEKSLGCIQKGGTSAVQGVLQYTEKVAQSGLNLLCAPGNDLVASTALAVSGCQMVLFTTGRGTPFGTCVPTLKVSTNNALAERKPHWIDFNAGSLLTGKTMDELLRDFIALVLRTAEGEPSLNERHGQSGIAIWKNGVTL